MGVTDSAGVPRQPRAPDGALGLPGSDPPGPDSNRPQPGCAVCRSCSRPSPGGPPQELAPRRSPTSQGSPNPAASPGGRDCRRFLGGKKVSTHPDRTRTDRSPLRGLPVLLPALPRRASARTRSSPGPDFAGFPEPCCVTRRSRLSPVLGWEEGLDPPGPDSNRPQPAARSAGLAPTAPRAVSTSPLSPVRVQPSQIEKAPVGGLFNLGRLTGLEPATPGITIQYSNQLSYSRRWTAQIILVGPGRPAGTFGGLRSSNGMLEDPAE